METLTYMCWLAAQMIVSSVEVLHLHVETDNLHNAHHISIWPCV
jgi:hypothetical protein